MINRKFFFFDIDGTLVDNNTGRIVPSAYEALSLLKQNGHFVAIATGRAHYKAIDFALSIGVENMVCNGGYGIVVNKKLVHNQPLEKDLIVDVLNQANDLGYGILLALNDSIEAYGKDITFLKQAGFRKEPTRYYIDSNFDLSKVEQIYKAYVSISKEEEYKLTKKGNLGALRFVNEYLMFQHDDKKWGIEKMMEIMDGNLEDVVVFGDDFNDLVMFDKRWYSIAMGNACQELKDKADCICDSNINDGIYKICKQKEWI